MNDNERHQAGLTLIELMIVVVIIGILSALAIPRWWAITTKNKQSEAKLILKQVWVNEQVYFQEHETYWLPGGAVASATAPMVLAPIITEIMPSARYSYSIAGTALTFTATAISGILDDDPTVDEWTIDETGVLRVVPGHDDSQD